MADRTLARPVTVGGVEYAAGTSEKDITAEHRELIKNPKAWDTEAAGMTGNVAVGPTQNFISVENPLPRATAAKTADDEDPKAAPSPAKSAPAKASPAKATAPKAD
jgi:hypothetical protein